MHPLRLLTVRMLLSHLLVATLSSTIAGILLTLFITSRIPRYEVDYYRYLARLTIAQWAFGDPDGQPNAPGVPPGFGLVVSPEDTVLLGYGDTTCRAGLRLAVCAPQMQNQSPGARFVTVNGQPWGQVIQPTVTGQRAIVFYGPVNLGPSLIIGSLTISGPLPFMLFVTGVILVIALPLALAVVWFWARPMTHRISHIATVSQAFATGDFAARVHDSRQDELGSLAQHFDDMADTLASNVDALRELAQQNASLARQAEQSAIQTERMRLSRDLHDDIAQQLFSISISAATLPDMIHHHSPHAKQQAQRLATQAEQTLLSLRTLLVELRPSQMLAHGFPTALEALCADWEASQHIPVQYSDLLSGRPLSAAIEDVVYRVVQEALHNIAKHARATTVAVSLVEGPRHLTVSVTDDGTGFDLDQVAVGHLGLVSMRERARAVGGSVVFERASVHGTTVRLTLPMLSEATQ